MYFIFLLMGQAPKPNREREKSLYITTPIVQTLISPIVAAGSSFLFWHQHKICSKLLSGGLPFSYENGITFLLLILLRISWAMFVHIVLSSCLFCSRSNDLSRSGGSLWWTTGKNTDNWSSLLMLLIRIEYVTISLI